MEGAFLFSEQENCDIPYCLNFDLLILNCILIKSRDLAGFQYTA